MPTQILPNRSARLKPIGLRVINILANQGAPVFFLWVKSSKLRGLAAVLVTLYRMFQHLYNPNALKCFYKYKQHSSIAFAQSTNCSLKCELETIETNTLYIHCTCTSLCLMYEHQNPTRCHSYLQACITNHMVQCINL